MNSDRAFHGQRVLLEYFCLICAWSCSSPPPPPVTRQGYGNIMATREIHISRLTGLDPHLTDAIKRGQRFGHRREVWSLDRKE